MTISEASHDTHDTHDMTKRIEYNEYKRKHRESFPDDTWRKTRDQRYYKRLMNSFMSHSIDNFLSHEPRSPKDVNTPSILRNTKNRS